MRRVESLSRLRSLAPVLLVLAAAACREDPGRAADGVDLHRSLLAARRIALFAPPEARPTAERAAAVVRSHGMELELVESPAEAHPGAVRVVLGDATTLEATGHLLAAAGIEPDGDGFVFANRRYDDPDDAVFVCIEDPDRPGLPLNLAYAGRAMAALAYAPDLTPASRTGYRVFRRGALDREGRFGPAGKLDMRERRDVGVQRSRTLSRYVRFGMDGFAWKGPPLRGPRVPAAEQRDALRERLSGSSVLGRLRGARTRLYAIWDPNRWQALDERVLLITLYATIEEKVLATDDWRGSSMNPADLRVHLVWPQGPGEYGGDAGNAWGRAYALQQAGAPADLWLLDGVGVYAADRWWGRRLADWIAHLESAGRLPDLATIVAGGPHVSDHVLRPARGALVRWLVAREGGRGRVRRLWQGDETFEPEAEEAAWRAWLDGWLAPSRAILAAERERRSAAVRARDFRRGVHLTPESWFDDPVGDLTGYGGSAAERSLEDARALGCDAVALTTFAFVQRGSPDYFGLGAGPATVVPDAALFRTLVAAREKGFATMLRPHLLASRSTTWNTAMPLPGMARWQRALSELETHVAHYALLAELAGCDLLCVATGLRQATDTELDRPGRYASDLPLCELKLERWFTIIAGARRSFGGGLVYAAANTAELAAVEFWPELDFVGLDLYPQLFARDSPRRWLSTMELERQFEVAFLKLRDASVKSRRPVLVTEIGLPSASRSRQDPRWLAGGVDLAEQERLYDAFRTALAGVCTEGCDEWMRGLFVWRWSTDPEAGGSSDPGWSPQKKPAAQVLRRLFAEM